MRDVVYVPGRYDKRVVQPEDCLRSVTKTGYSPVEAPDSPARHRIPSQKVTPDWDGAGVWTVWAMLSALLLLDLAAFWGFVWWTGR